MPYNHKKRLFDSEADDNVSLRKIFGGSTTNINNFNELKYKWTAPLYREMTANYWIPEIINLAKDKVQYRELEPEEKEAYDETLSFLIFLDSIQSTSLPSIGDYITAPEVYRLIALQTFQEVIHSQAYSYILESICDAQEIHSIYYRFKNDEKLNERCQQMTSLYSRFRDDPTDENLAILIISIYMLEGLLFFNGFYFFYALAYNGKMTKSADEIRLIQRDELTHLEIFVNIMKEMFAEMPGLITQEIFNLIIEPIVNLEIEWATKVYGKGLLGITKHTIPQFTYFRINYLAGLLGFTTNYPQVENPYPHLDEIATDNGSVIKTGFFETRLTSYDFAVTMEGWDKI